MLSKIKFEFGKFRKIFVGLLFFNFCFLIFLSLAWANWGIERIENVGAAAFTSIALDTNNYPHISYCGNNSLTYAKWNNAPTLSWTGETNYTSDERKKGDRSNIFRYVHQSVIVCCRAGLQPCDKYATLKGCPTRNATLKGCPT